MGWLAVGRLPWSTRMMPHDHAPQLAAELAAIAARCATASPGPWRWARTCDGQPPTEADWDGDVQIWLRSSSGPSGNGQDAALSVLVLTSNTADLLAADAAFIAHARADVSRLLAEVRRLRALVGEQPRSDDEAIAAERSAG